MRHNCKTLVNYKYGCIQTTTALYHAKLSHNESIHAQLHCGMPDAIPLMPDIMSATFYHNCRMRPYFSTTQTHLGAVTQSPSSDSHPHHPTTPHLIRCPTSEGHSISTQFALLNFATISFLNFLSSSNFLVQCSSWTGCSSFHQFGLKMENNLGMDLVWSSPGISFHFVCCLLAPLFK